MSEVELKAVRDLYAYVPDSCKAAFSVEVDCLYQVIFERDKLRQQLEAAEARIVDLTEVVASCENLAASDLKKINGLEVQLRVASEINYELTGCKAENADLRRESYKLISAIREAREQKPIYQTQHYDESHWHDTDKNNFKVCESLSHVKTRILYAAPVPAMPIQDDNNGVLVDLLRNVWKHGFDSENYDDIDFCNQITIAQSNDSGKIIPNEPTLEAIKVLKCWVKNGEEFKAYKSLVAAINKSEVNPSC